MDPRGHCDTLGSHGTKDIIVALLGCMAPRAQCEEAIAAFQGPVQPQGHGDPAGHRGSMETIVALQGPMES